MLSFVNVEFIKELSSLSVDGSRVQRCRSLFVLVKLVWNLDQAVGVLRSRHVDIWFTEIRDAKSLGRSYVCACIYQHRKRALLRVWTSSFHALYIARKSGRSVLGIQELCDYCFFGDVYYLGSNELPTIIVLRWSRVPQQTLYSVCERFLHSTIAKEYFKILLSYIAWAGETAFQHRTRTANEEEAQQNQHHL